jgi:hypothetical protein
MDESPILCPSARCEDGAVLVGIVLSDGRIAFAGDRVLIDAEFVHIACQGRPPEKRFRFATPCARERCGQWMQGRCSVIDEVTSVAGVCSDPSPPPRCSIRARCRWFRQSGLAACGVCPEVITDLRKEEVQADLCR